MRRIARILLVLAAIVGVAAAWPRVFPPKPLSVKVFRVIVGEVRDTVSSPSAGTVISEHEAVVASEAAGRVVEVKFREGDRAGDHEAVVALDSADAELDLKAAKAGHDRQAGLLEEARLKLKKAVEDAERVEGSRSVISDDQFRAAESARDVAKAEVEWTERALAEAGVAVERAAVALSKRAIRAPFTGVIRRKRVEVGEFVLAGQACFEIYDDLHIYVKAPIDEVDLPRIEPGRPVEVSLESFPERIFHGRVRDIDPAVRTTQDLNRTGEVEIDLLDAPEVAKDGSYPPGEGPIRVGMSADVEIIARVKASVLKVPSYAVHEDDAGRYVYVLAEGRIARRAVKSGVANWDYAEVQEGLAEGEPVVVTLDVEGLKPGALAEIAGEVSKVTPR
jgi:HlyD family secretion protein